MNAAVFTLPEPSLPGANVAFGNLVDLARLRISAPPAEICDACNTINLGSARQCKCCSHKLPAYFARPDAKGLGQALIRRWPAIDLPEKASALDLAAFWIVINSLVIVTAMIPIR